MSDMQREIPGIFSGLVGTALGVRTVSGALQSKITNQDRALKRQAALQAKRKAATSRFGTRLASRTRRVAAKSIAAIPAEAIPFVGVAVLIADTGYELYSACETMRDLDRLYTELGMAQRTPDDVIHAPCNPGLPDAAEIWEDVMEQGGVWLNQVGLNPRQHP